MNHAKRPERGFIDGATLLFVVVAAVGVLAAGVSVVTRPSSQTTRSRAEDTGATATATQTPTNTPTNTPAAAAATNTPTNTPTATATLTSTPGQQTPGQATATPPTGGKNYWIITYNNASIVSGKIRLNLTVQKTGYIYGEPPRVSFFVEHSPKDFYSTFLGSTMTWSDMLTLDTDMAVTKDIFIDLQPTQQFVDNCKNNGANVSLSFGYQPNLGSRFRGLSGGQLTLTKDDCQKLVGTGPGGSVPTPTATSGGGTTPKPTATTGPLPTGTASQCFSDATHVCASSDLSKSSLQCVKRYANQDWDATNNPVLKYTCLQQTCSDGRGFDCIVYKIKGPTTETAAQELCNNNTTCVVPTVSPKPTDIPSPTPTKAQTCQAACQGKFGPDSAANAHCCLSSDSDCIGNKIPFTSDPSVPVGDNICAIGTGDCYCGAYSSPTPTPSKPAPLICKDICPTLPAGDTDEKGVCLSAPDNKYTHKHPLSSQTNCKASGQECYCKGVPPSLTPSPTGGAAACYTAQEYCQEYIKEGDSLRYKCIQQSGQPDMAILCASTPQTCGRDNKLWRCTIMTFKEGKTCSAGPNYCAHPGGSSTVTTPVPAGNPGSCALECSKQADGPWVNAPYGGDSRGCFPTDQACKDIYGANGAVLHNVDECKIVGPGGSTDTTCCCKKANVTITPPTPTSTPSITPTPLQGLLMRFRDGTTDSYFESQAALASKGITAPVQGLPWAVITGLDPLYQPSNNIPSAALYITNATVTLNLTGSSSQYDIATRCGTRQGTFTPKAGGGYTLIAGRETLPGSLLGTGCSAVTVDPAPVLPNANPDVKIPGKVIDFNLEASSQCSSFQDVDLNVTVEKEAGACQ